MPPTIMMDDRAAIPLSMIRQMLAYYSRLLRTYGLTLEIIFGKEAKSLAPNKIWVPDLPDDAPMELREMVLWIAYHEMSHLWNTDFQSGWKLAIASFPGDEVRARKWQQLAANVHNIVEDPRIELIWNQSFDGTWALAHRATFTVEKKIREALKDPAGDFMFQAGSKLISQLRAHQFAGQGFEPHKVAVYGNPLVTKLYPSIFEPEFDVLKDNVDNAVSMAAAQRIFSKLVDIMGDPPPPPPPPPTPPKRPKGPVKVGGVVKDKATKEYEVVKSINPDGSFEVEVVDKKTAKEIAKRLYEEESSGRKV